MKMPEKIEPAVFASCGMNCLVCYKHFFHKKPCAGCLKSDQVMAAFLVQQKENYICSECEGIISIHDAECSECQWKM